jgi:uncharacterized protein (TIGR03085 family)
MGSSIALRERQALADLFSQLGPNQPTLCAGWTTADLAAHLVLRERRPDAAVGILGGPLAKWSKRILSKSAPRFIENVEKLRAGAPLWSPLRWFDSQANTLEMLIHHEDVRRAQPNWQPRDLSVIDGQLWQVLKRSSRFLMRRLDVPLTLLAPDGRTLGSDEGVRVMGEPLEILLYLTGRVNVARVDVSGQGPDKSRLRI